MKRALALCGALAFVVLAEGRAHAQTYVEREVYTEPNRPMIYSGIFTLGVSYAASAVVAGTSGLDADRLLFVPVVGPWLDLAARPQCPISAPSCNPETAARVGLVFDGVIQAIGTLSIVSGLLWRHEVVVKRVAKVNVSPYFGPTGSGVALSGRF